MAKVETKDHRIANRPLYSRVSYLVQAATYFQSVHARTTLTQDSESVLSRATVPLKNDNVHMTDNQETTSRTSQALPNACRLEDNSSRSQTLVGVEQIPLPLSTQRYLTSQLRAVASKGQIRLARQMKHRFCKKCLVILDDTTSTRRIENNSRGGKKPWADVCVVKCVSCNSVKRYAIGAERQVARTARAMKGEA